MRRRPGYSDHLPGMCLALSLFFLLAAPGAYGEVTSLRYGLGLFHSFQGDYFDALTELMIAEQLGELSTNSADAELLQGSIALSYGMSNQAEQRFNRLVQDGALPSYHDLAWFHLARVAWSRGEHQALERALANIGADLKLEQSQQASYLAARLELERGELDAVEQRLLSMSEDSTWTAYTHWQDCKCPYQ